MDVEREIRELMTLANSCDIEEKLFDIIKYVESLEQRLSSAKHNLKVLEKRWGLQRDAIMKALEV